MIDRGLILRPEYIKEHDVKCEICGKVAYATHYDKDWDARDYCAEHYPISQMR